MGSVSQADVPRGVVPVEVRVGAGSVRVQGLEDLVLSPEQVLAVGTGGGAASLAPYCGVSEHLAEARCAAALMERASTTRVWRMRAAGQTLALDDGAAPRSTLLPLRLEGRWLGQLAAWMLGTRAAPPELVEPLAAQKPFYKRWWFWTAVGVVAAGALTTYLMVPKGGAFIEPRVAITGLRWR